MAAGDVLSFSQTIRIRRAVGSAPASAAPAIEATANHGVTASQPKASRRPASCRTLNEQLRKPRPLLLNDTIADRPLTVIRASISLAGDRVVASYRLMIASPSFPL